MVALASWIQPEEEESTLETASGNPRSQPENRVGNFFEDVPDRVGESEPQVVDCVWVILVVEYDSRRSPSLAQSSQARVSPEVVTTVTAAEILRQGLGTANIARVAGTAGATGTRMIYAVGGTQHVLGVVSQKLEAAVAAGTVSPARAVEIMASVAGATPGDARAMIAKARIAERTLQEGLSTVFVVRGGGNTPQNFLNGSGVTVGPNGILQGVSVNSAPGLTVAELSVGIPHNKIGVTTVQAVQVAGGSVVPSPTGGNPVHATLSGITAETASALMQPVIPNPSKIK